MSEELQESRLACRHWTAVLGLDLTVLDPEARTEDCESRNSQLGGTYSELRI